MATVFNLRPDQSLSNVESEFALLCALLFDGKRVEMVADLLQPEHFSEAFYGRVYSIIVREHSKGHTLNPMTLKPFLEGDAAYQSLGGIAFIASLTNPNAGLVQAKATAKQLIELYRRRELSAGLTDALACVANVNEPVETCVDVAEGALSAASVKSEGVREISAAGAMSALIKNAEQPKRTINSKIVPSMDNLIGLRPKQLVIGGGRPGMGKTAAALSFSLGAAMNGHGVLFVSLEMGAEELAARMAADLSFDGKNGVAYADINSDNPSRRAVQAMGDAHAMLSDLPFHILDAGSMTIARLEILVKRFKRRFAAKGTPLDLVVVDYLQLLRGDERGKSSYEVVSESSRRLKGIAKDQDVAVLALAQLSREVEKRQDRRPQLSDLKDSGQLEQDADCVLFFYRHEYYLRQEPEATRDEHALSQCEGMIDFICAKRRNGVVGDAVGQFHGKFQAVRG